MVTPSAKQDGRRARLCDSLIHLPPKHWVWRIAGPQRHADHERRYCSTALYVEGMSLTDGRYAGRVAIVTGASRGIGATIAKALAAEGAAVVVAARTQVEGQSRHSGSTESVAFQIRERGGESLSVRCDVARESDRVALVAAAKHAFGPVDILINNAAAFGTTDFLALPLRRMQLCFEVNVFAAYHLMQLVLPDMVEREQGWIVNITSDASRRPAEGPYSGQPSPGGAAYGCSKLALEFLTRSVASEMFVHGVAVNSLMPSMAVPTPSMLDAVPELNEFVTSESFAEATLHLASCNPAVYNGQALYSEDVLHPELGTRGWLSDSM
jgi:NAD(P)-dependent dehydrogenase (short-subunit alcohol dehydrogenase family)